MADVELAGSGWTGRVTCAARPYQVEGIVDGCAFYFRAEDGIWTIGICDETGDTEQHREAAVYAEDHGRHDIHAWYSGENTCDDAENNPPRRPLVMLEEGFAAWREARLEHIRRTHKAAREGKRRG